MSSAWEQPAPYTFSSVPSNYIPTHRGFFRYCIGLAVGCGLLIPAKAGPDAWTDILTRHRTWIASEQGVITGVASTHPLVPWVEESLRDRVYGHGDELSHSVRAGFGGDGVPLPTLGQTAHDSSANYSLDYLSPRWAARVSATVQTRQGDVVGTERRSDLQGTESDLVLDESFGAFKTSTWAFGIGRMSRYWGTGWSGSLILGDAARPVPAIFVRHHSETPSPAAWLRWLGPTDFSFFVATLESDRHIPNARMMGMRFVIRPHARVEIGAHRTAIFGGDGRSTDLEAVLRGADGDGNGDQRAGFDIRVLVKAPDTTQQRSLSSSVYIQTVGEDEANILPSAHMSLIGTDLAVHSHTGWTHRYFVEAVNTIAGAFTGHSRINAGYRNSEYRSGYTYYRRPLGYASDGDSFTLVMGGIHDLDWWPRVSFAWSVAHITLNDDGSNAEGFLPHLFSASQQTTGVIGTLSARLAYDHFSFDLTVRGGNWDRLSEANVGTATVNDPKSIGVTVRYQW